jgi:hypothetical protein
MIRGFERCKKEIETTECDLNNKYFVHWRLKAQSILQDSSVGLFGSEEGDESGPSVADTRGDDDDDSETMSASPSLDDPDELVCRFNQEIWRTWSFYITKKTFIISAGTQFLTTQL